MNNALIDDTLRVSYPEGFHVMDEQEMQEAYKNDNPCRWCIRDKERGMMLSVFWFKSFALLVRIADAKAAVRKIASSMEKALGGMNYERGDLYARDICGQKAWGFGYEYTLNEVDQHCEVIMLKNKSSTYTVYYYSDKDKDEENRIVFEEFLGTFVFE